LWSRRVGRTATSGRVVLSASTCAASVAAGRCPAQVELLQPDLLAPPGRLRVNFCLCRHCRQGRSCPKVKRGCRGKPVKELLDTSVLTRLEGYRLVKQQFILGQYGGFRHSRRKGGTVEFADYREYTAGDELRRVDWKAYARLGRLYIKEFLDEKQDTTLFLIDASASMDWGGNAHKGRYALQIAAGLGICALAGNDRLVLILTGGKEELNMPEYFTKESGVEISPALKGRTAIPRLSAILKAVTFGGKAGLAESLRHALNIVSGIKNLYVFSDLYDSAGVEETLRLSAGRDLEVTLLHILSPEERLPSGEGEYLLVDAEAGTQVEISLGPAAYLAYSRRLEGFYQTLDNYCRRWGVRRILLDSGEGAADTLFKTLPRAGVLKTRG